MLERLDKCLANQNIGSRNEVQKMVRDGRVRVDGKIILRPEQKIDSDSAEIEVGGVHIDFHRFIYIMQHKPKGVISASRGNETRPTVIDILPDALKRKNLFPAGRLDAETTGFVLITDDGAFAHDILAPSRHVPKTYHVESDLPLSADSCRRMEEGMLLGDGTQCRPVELTVLAPCEYRVVLREGRYHQIRRMFGAAGCAVTELKREKIGGLSLDPTLAAGESRLITKQEKGIIES